MKLDSITYPEKYVCQMQFSADAAELAAGAKAAWQKAYDAHKCTTPWAEASQDEQAFYYDAVNAILSEKMPPLYRAAQEKEKIHPVALPACHLISISKEKGFTAAALASLLPELELRPYTCLTQKRTVAPVTEKDRAAALERLQKKYPQLEEHDGPAAMGDTVVLDFRGTVDGRAFAHGEAEGFRLRLGSKTMLEGFEEGICGHCAKEEFDIPVKFPPVFHSADDLAGKTASFHICLHQVGRGYLPPVDDAFAKQAGFADVKALQADVLEKLENQHREAADRKAREDLLNQLAGLAKGELPAPLVEREFEQQMNQLMLSLQLQHSSMDMLLKQTGMTKEQMTARVRDHADALCRRDMALLNIAKREHLEPDEQELEAEIAARAAQHKCSREQFLASVDPNLMMQSILRARAENFVVSHAKFIPG